MHTLYKKLFRKPLLTETNCKCKLPIKHFQSTSGRTVLCSTACTSSVNFPPGAPWQQQWSSTSRLRRSASIGAAVYITPRRARRLDSATSTTLSSAFSSSSSTTRGCSTLTLMSIMVTALRKLFIPPTESWRSLFTNTESISLELAILEILEQEKYVTFRTSFIFIKQLSHRTHFNSLLLLSGQILRCEYSPTWWHGRRKLRIHLCSNHFQSYGDLPTFRCGFAVRCWFFDW